MDDRDDLDYVALRFSADAAVGGELFVAARADGFSGRSSAWFNPAELAEFAKLLESYPLPDGPPIAIAGGYWSRNRPGELSQERVRLEVQRTGSLGHIVVGVHLASYDGPDARYDVRLQMLTTYERLRGFSQQIVLVVRDKLDEARLEGGPFA